MNCPRECNAQLLMMERSGVEIDYCPVCRGVWLDRGELDKLIDRSFSASQGVDRSPPARDPNVGDLMPDPRRRERRDWDDDDDDDDYKRRRKKSFLGELFDF